MSGATHYPIEGGWTDAQLAMARRLWGEGVATAKIGGAIGKSKNAVIGKAHRLGWPARSSPIRPRDPTSKEQIQKSRGIARRRRIVSLRDDAEIGSAPEERLSEYLRRPYIEIKPPVAPILVGPVRECCFPLGEPRTRDFRYCDEPTLPGGSYCAAHHAITHVQVRDRRQDVAA